MAPALLIAAAMAVTPLPVLPPPAVEPSSWYGLQTLDAGDGATAWELAAGHRGLSLSARYVPPAPRRYAPADVTLNWRRDLDAHHTLDLQLWRGLNRAGGGLGAGFTLRRALR